MARELHPRDRALFYRQLATTLDAGLSARQSLTALSRDKGAIGDRARSLEALLRDSSVDLGEAVARCERDPVVGPARAALLRNAWTTGRFVEVLKSLGRESEEQLRAARRLRGSLLRPFLLACLVPVLLGLPRLFAGGVGPYLVAVMPPLLLIVGIGAAAFRVAGRSPALPRSLPLLGPVMRERALSHACLSLHHFFNAGMSPVLALEGAARAAGPGPEGDELRRIAAEVQRGQTLSQSLARSSLPPILRGFLQTGEVSGNLAEMAHAGWRHHEEEAHRRFQRLARVLAGVVTTIAMGWAALKIVGGFQEHFGAVQEAIE